MTQFGVYSRLSDKGVQIILGHDLDGTCQAGVTLRDVRSEKYSTIDDVDLVVLAEPQHALDALAHSLRGVVAEVALIGDARAPRTLLEAMHEGHHVSRAVALD